MDGLSGTGGGALSKLGRLNQLKSDDIPDELQWEEFEVANARFGNPGADGISTGPTGLPVARSFDKTLSQG